MRHNFSRSEANHYAYYKKFDDGIFIMYFLYVDDMLVASNNMKKIIDLKSCLAMKFEMKNLRA